MTGWFKVQSTATLALLGMALLSGCASSAEPSSTEVSGAPTPAATDATEVPESSDSPATPTPAPEASIGQLTDSAGLEITVLKAWKQKTLTYQGNTYSQETPNGKKKTITAPQDGRYVYVKTTGTNNTKSGIDLTCGYPVEAYVFDSEGRRFDEVDGLSQVKGNPGCNDEVAPGFKFNMTYVYLVPPRAEPTVFQYSSVSPKLNNGPKVRVNIAPVEEE